MEKSEINSIVIQGHYGAFHEIAARKFFAPHEVSIIASDRFEDVIELTRSGPPTRAGIMAIENTIAGSILKNYALINQSELVITGEIFIHIEQNLMALPGVTIQDLTEVHSHYMAIAQCKPFFEAHPHIKLVESNDTAESAKDIRLNKRQSVGAIASSLAAEMYELDMIARGIETNKLNFTRFVILEKENSISSDHFDKVSISFAVRHEVGRLFQVLNILQLSGANLTKIQSTPIVGHPWEYLFFMDFILTDTENYPSIIHQLQSVTHQLKILGTYKSGIRYDY